MGKRGGGKELGGRGERGTHSEMIGKRDKLGRKGIKGHKEEEAGRGKKRMLRRLGGGRREC